MNDVDWLRQVFGPLDPARDEAATRTTRAPTPLALRTEPARVPARPLRWAVPALVAITVLAIAVTAAAVRMQLQPATSGPSRGISQSPTAARAQYDHVSWQVWRDGTLEQTEELWFNGAGGRLLTRSASGHTISDLALRPPADQATGTRGSRTPLPNATATLAMQNPLVEADEFPGRIPTDVAGMRHYVDPSGTADALAVGRRISGLLFARALTQAQMRSLLGVARDLRLPQQQRRTPDGRTVLALSLPAQLGSRTLLLVSSSGVALAGVADVGPDGTRWRLLLGSDLRAQAR